MYVNIKFEVFVCVLCMLVYEVFMSVDVNI